MSCSDRLQVCSTGSNCGLRVTGRPVFSVQHHPKASPGPQDSHYLFRRFFNLIRERKGLEPLPERDHAA
jgi:carbamoyl-phosphate synthase small subunit